LRLNDQWEYPTEETSISLIDYLADEFRKDQGIDLEKGSMASAVEEAAEKAKIELPT
jgi:molecular chaperone DnaK